MRFRLDPPQPNLGQIMTLAYKPANRHPDPPVALPPAAEEVKPSKHLHFPHPLGNAPGTYWRDPHDFT